MLQSPRRRLLGRDGLQELARIADASGLSEPLATALRLAVAQLASELGEQQIAIGRWTALASSISDPTLRATAFLAASRAASQIIDRKDEAFPLIDMAANEASDDPVLGVEIESHRGRLLQVVKHRGQEGRAATFRLRPGPSAVRVRRISGGFRAGPRPSRPSTRCQRRGVSTPWRCWLRARPEPAASRMSAERGRCRSRHFRSTAAVRSTSAS